MVPVTIEYHVITSEGKKRLGQPRLFFAIPLATWPCIGWTIIFCVEEFGRHRELSGKVVDVVMTAGEPTVRVVLEHMLVRRHVTDESA